VYLCSSILLTRHFIKLKDLKIIPWYHLQWKREILYSFIPFLYMALALTKLR